MQIEKLKGTGVALVTPFDASLKVDFSSLEKLIEHCIPNGVNYLVSLGTTGESATLNKTEKEQVLQQTRDIINGRVPLVAGFGGNNTQQIVDDIQHFDLRGVDAILSVSPFYNKPTQEGICKHYEKVANSTSLPIILYNVPGRTGSNISAETTLRLAHDFENIVAIKEASGDLSQCMEIVNNKPDDFLVISGEDLLTLPMISFGMDGVISVVANAFPKEYAEMVRLALKGNYQSAAKLHFDLMKIIQLLFVEGNPGGVKAALEILDICKNHLRLPLAPISHRLNAQLKSEIQELISIA